ncbi:MAG: GNAT family N-acetyltransferase [Pararhodobacter sp.]
MTCAPAIALAGVPELRTERLILRGPELRDFEPCAAYAASDRSRFTGGPMTRELAWRAFCHTTGHWVHRGYGPFTVETRDGLILGCVGPFFPEGWPEPEIAWTIWNVSVEGRGYAFEAAQAALRHAYGALGWSTAISMINPDNERSVALARRMGCRLDGSFQHERFGLCDLWRHPGPDALVDGGMEADA